ncbi:MAG: hypothetical protein ABI162_07145 [Luteolibacter sp.]
MTTANTKRKNVLVACESSGTVRDAFRKLGHNAWSCDLLPTDADPAYHIQGDALEVARTSKACWDTGNMGWKWDLIIAHPPCTYLANSGVRWLYGRQGFKAYSPRHPDARANGHVLNRARWAAMREGATFFAKLLCFGVNNGIPIAVENPIMHCHAKEHLRHCGVLETKQTQVIQPWMFGHPETKATCLWLRGLPKLAPTKIVPPVNGSTMWKLPPSKDRWKIRSKTYSGIAAAMAQQWGGN